MKGLENRISLLEVNRPINADPLIIERYTVDVAKNGGPGQRKLCGICRVGAYSLFRAPDETDDSLRERAKTVQASIDLMERVS